MRQIWIRLQYGSQLCNRTIDKVQQEISAWCAKLHEHWLDISFAIVGQKNRFQSGEQFQLRNTGKMIRAKEVEVAKTAKRTEELPNMVRMRYAVDAKTDQ